MPTQAHDHPEFDALCERLEDFEPLPSVSARDASPGDHDHREDRAIEAVELDEQILAGLVSV